MGIVGYADHMTIEPGQTLRVMVSTSAPSYRAEIVRIIHGDHNSRGPGVKESVIDTLAGRVLPGRRQALPLGSYAIVPDSQALDITRDFSITAWIAPTRHNPAAPGGTAPDGDQGIVTKWSPGQGGFGLFIQHQQADARIALWVADKTGTVAKASLDRPLRPWVPTISSRPQHVDTHWYFVAASYDADTGAIRLYQRPVHEFGFDPTFGTMETATTLRGVGANDNPLLIAGTSGAAGADGPAVTGRYNGKIDNPRLYGRALTTSEMDAIFQGRGPGDAIASWDFSLNIPTNQIADASPRRLNGTLVNLPTRAVTGHNWTGKELDYRRAPDQYGAIYFHDDDLEDAKWNVDFEYTLPTDLRSGVYAARLRTDTAEDYVPFFVRPRGRTPTSRLALLIPTHSYLAYGATGGAGFNTLSTYARHTDGSGITYSSRLRPITNMRPKLERRPWQFVADTHIVDWLEEKDLAPDVITDQDLHFEGAALLRRYKAVMTGSHPEYYSQEMMDATREYLESGGRLIYMGGNGYYWVTPMDPSGRYIETRKRDGTEAWQGAPGEHHHSITGEPGGLWRFRGVPPQRIVGVGFTAQGFDTGAPYRRLPGSFDPRAAFIFEGIGRDELIGDFPVLVLPEGAAGSELDRVDYALGSPAHTLILAQSFGHSDEYQHVVEEVNTSNSRQGGTVNNLVHAHLAFLEYPNGGAVFSTGSISWAGALSYNNYTNNVSRITENVLRRFISDEPIPMPEEVSSTGSDR
jgi:N,N-dimethylformamidase